MLREQILLFKLLKKGQSAGPISSNQLKLCYPMPLWKTHPSHFSPPEAPRPMITAPKGQMPAIRLQYISDVGSGVRQLAPANATWQAQGSQPPTSGDPSQHPSPGEPIHFSLLSHPAGVKHGVVPS